MIEFREGEKYCRWNGELMSPKNHKKLFGVEYEVYTEDGWIDDGETIYTDMPIGKILMKMGEVFGEPEEYDSALSQGYGWKDHCWESKLAGHIMFRTGFIEHLQVKPMAQFKKDYPNFNRKLHNKFYDELNAYYEKEFPGQTECVI